MANEAAKVAIAGAGIGGLAAALALIKQGIDVQLYEKAPELKEVGAGIQLSPNGTRVLQALGLGDELQALGTPSSGKEVRVWNSGVSRQFMELGDRSVERYGAPYLTFHRADLHDMLLRAVRAARPDAVHLAAACEGFVQHEDSVELVLSSGEKARASALIGADGVHSRIRQTLFGPDRAEFTGCMAWRGVIPAGTLPASIKRTGGVSWLGPTAHVLTYPVRQGKLLNFIGMVDKPGWTSDSWTEQGSREECLEDFQGWHEDVRAMVERIAIPYKWALIVRQPLARWSVGRVTLLGDACHSTLPFLAQGANMAIEDAFVLARCLAGSGDVPAALVRYEQARLERTTRIVLSSAEQIHRVHTPALAQEDTARAHLEREWQPKDVEDRYDWVYGYDATSVELPR